MAGEEKLPILVVEDEEPIRRGLCDVLAYHGYAPAGAADGAEGLRQGLSNRYALILLDVMLPEINGFEVCRALRDAHPHLPILMVTARGSEEDVLEGFRAGADDYVTKPFSVAEVMARVEAILRRSGRILPDEQRPFEFAGWQVEPANLRARKGDRDAELTSRELAILALFLRERGRIVSRRTLLAEIWETPDPDRVETRSVDMQIAKLRKKLGFAAQDKGGPGGPIQTVRGAGYRFGG
jgi:DNA-binding response OmpR family regulator